VGVVEESRVADRRIPVFFYGLFMDAGALTAKGLHPTNVRRASLPGHGLRIGERAALVPTPDGRVHGMLMDLTHGEIDRLYSEPGVSVYRAEPVVCDTDGGSVVALAFNLPVPPGPEQSNPAYAEKLRSLAARLQLPVEYVDSIR
jgi:hypothetical protein